MTCTLIDVMSCVPIEVRSFEVGPQEYLSRLLTLISTLRGGESRYLPLVRTKISETLPSVASTVTQPLTLLVPSHYAKDLKEEPNPSSSGSSPTSSPQFTHYYPLP